MAARFSASWGCVVLGHCALRGSIKRMGSSVKEPAATYV
jgi:hypothetical protein